MIDAARQATAVVISQTLRSTAQSFLSRASHILQTLHFTVPLARAARRRSLSELKFRQWANLADEFIPPSALLFAPAVCIIHLVDVLSRSSRSAAFLNKSVWLSCCSASARGVRVPSCCGSCCPVVFRGSSLVSYIVHPVTWHYPTGSSFIQIR